MKRELGFEEIIKEELESMNEMIKDVSAIRSKKAGELLVVLKSVKLYILDNQDPKKCGDLILLLPLLYVQKKELSKA
ncbi:MAG: hypothetical protein COB42_00400 [Sulfurimonas sp.]|nr:MAG: hypothetical protein COB42_00400 [Sulfurimonas sp.]